MKALKAMTLAQLELQRWVLNEAVQANDELAADGDLGSYDRRQWKKAQALLTVVEAAIHSRNRFPDRKGQ